MEEAQRKHDLLVQIVEKDQDHKRRLVSINAECDHIFLHFTCQWQTNVSILQRDFKERIQQQKSTQNRLREQRQQTARAKKYHNDYHVQHRARLMKARTKEERVSTQDVQHGSQLNDFSQYWSFFCLFFN